MQIFWRLFRRRFLQHILCASLVLSACLVVFAQNAAIQIVPQPKQIERTNEDFALRGNARVELADSKNADDRFAANDFIEDARKTANVNLKIGDGRILIGALDNPKIKRALTRVKFDVPTNLNDEGYALVVSKNGVVVAGKTAAGTFYGLQTLKQLLRGDGENAFLQGVKIVDFPTMRYRAFSDDISRGLVPTVDFIKRQIRTFAFFKMNMHSLYMEHTFASAAHPIFATEEGSLNANELREIVAYAKNYHVEIVPEQQTFGHLHKVLKFEKYNELSEVPYGDMVEPNNEKALQFVADLYKEIDQIFPSQFFHIGADETFELGQGRSREAVKAKGVGKVYFEHLNRVRAILQPYNRRLMMWGDIALNHPELIGEIPKDVIVMNWAYGARDSYASRIAPFEKAGLQQFVCPSVYNFNQIFPNNEIVAQNIRNFVRDGQAAGAIGVMNTSWDDDGETLFEMTWYGVALGAAAGWENAPLNVEEFDKKFDWAFFRSEDDEFTKSIRTLGAASKTLAFKDYVSQNAVFWQNPFTPQFQERGRSYLENIKKMRTEVETVEENLIKNQAKPKRNREMLPALAFAAERLDHYGRRFVLTEQLGQTYWDAYLTMSDRAKARKLTWYSGAIYNYPREMAEELGELKRKYRALFLAENKPSHLESVSARYDQAMQMWLDKSQQIGRAMTQYNETGTLPPPDAIGISARPRNNER